MRYAVEINKLSKSYKEILALDNIDLQVNYGEIFGLIGPDGAGKTTLIRILTTLLLADTGEATVLEKNVLSDYRALRKVIGYMPGRFSLYQDLTVEENLQLFATLFGTTIDENYHLIKDIYVLLEPFKKRKAGKLSGGMKQKLALCCALIHKPEILFLDEPTTGVDPVSRKEFWEMLAKLKEEQITILVSTPYMDEAALCDRVGLIQDGKLLTTDTPINIVNAFTKRLFSINASEKYRLIKDLEAFDQTHSVFLFGEHLHYTDKRSDPDTQNIIDYLEAKDHSNIEISDIQPTIEDCFMELAKSK